ncbi:hypothetical protein OROHE_009409 [Orobanche hederae]
MEREVGTGTFGSVWRALNKQSGEVVAIKNEEEILFVGRMYKSERSQSLRKMNHPNVVKLKEVIRESDVLYFVFEYMEYNLYQLMKDSRKPFSEVEVRNWCFQVFQGLTYIHQCGYFHRDLKPVVKVDQLEDKFGILNLLRDYVQNVEVTCPEIIPDLMETYKVYGKSELEIVFLWLGDDKEAFSNQFFLPWLAVLPEDERTVNVLTKEFDFQSPLCFLLFDRTGSLCLYDATTNINAYGVLGYPFTHEKIRK